MITTEELRALSESTHPLHGDLVRVAKELLELRGKTWLADVSNPARELFEAINYDRL